MDFRNLSDEKLSSILTFLVTFGHIDGTFDPAEQRFVSDVMNRLLAAMLAGTTPSDAQRAAKYAHLAAELDFVYQKISDQIEAFIDEGPRADDGGESFLYARLKVRCVELFRAFPPEDQKQILVLLESYMLADGRVAPEEKKLREQLVSVLTLPMPAAAPFAPGISDLRLQPVAMLPPQGDDHPFLMPLEQPFSPHPVELASQVEREIGLLGAAIGVWERQRERGNGRLRGVERVAQLAQGSAFLDRFTYVQRVDPIRPMELIVVGDLHGCYSCLKGVLLQTNFFQRVWAHQWDPVSYPDVKICFVGDYIDRGRYSLDGVLRVVLQMLVGMPDHVFVLRGNHESFMSTPYGVRSAVYPAEAIGSLAPHVPPQMLDAYRVLFENMPATLLFDRTMIAHGGIPRDDTFQGYRDLSSLNDPEVRFQMMWSDPAQAEHVPLEMQRENGRFSFGRGQFRAFMERTGFQTLIRGHEKIEDGYRVVFDLGGLRLINLFSAGGASNIDLPPSSSYRKVTPMAMTLLCHDGVQDAYPWRIDWQPFNAPGRNGFLRGLPELPFMSG